MQTAEAAVPTIVSEEMQQTLDRIYAGAQQCLKAIKWLDAQGFVPVAMIAGRANKPVIQIETSPLCMSLKRDFDAYYYITRIGKNGREQVWRAVLFNCYVEWTERG